MEVRIALAQLAPHLGELDANLELVSSRLAEAVADGADIVVFSELALTGYLLQDLVPEVAIRADDPRLLGIGADAPEVMVAVGFVEETRARRYCNSVALLRGGRLIGLHRKVYLPTYGLFDEGRFTRAGHQIRATEVGDPLHKVGLSVCEDFWHPFLPMLQVQDGALLLINVAAGPARAPGSAAGLAAIGGWHKMQETYALLGTVTTIFLGRPLVGLNYRQSDLEANFRADLIHVRENAESVALLRDSSLIRPARVELNSPPRWPSSDGSPSSLPRSPSAARSVRRQSR